jgi:hypothetical protein
MDMTTTMDADRFSIKFYFQSLAKALGTPGTFFRELPENTGFQQSVGFLVVSSVFFAVASLTTREFEAPWISSSIFFANAVGMTFIAAGFGYITMTMFWGRKVTFRRFFSVYAFASGVTLLASWIPLFVFITEPWKWLMIGIGLTKTCGLKWLNSVLIIVMSIGMIVLFFRSLLPIISSI